MAQRKHRIAYLIAFSLYILAVLYLTVFRFDARYDERRLNLSLFVDLANVYRNVGAVPFTRLFLGNIGWFVPFGFLFPVLLPAPLRRKRFLATMAAGFVFSLLIEVTQYIFYIGVAELDDLILNTFGVAVGYLFFHLGASEPARDK